MGIESGEPVGSIGSLAVNTNFRLTSYVDGSATPGDATVNAIRGKNSFAIGASVVVITNNKVTTASQVVCSLEFVDASLTTILTAIPTANTITVTGNANATAATKFSWTVINP